MELHRVTYRVSTLAVISQFVRTEDPEDCWKEFRDNVSQTAGVKCALGFGGHVFFPSLHAVIYL